MHECNNSQLTTAKANTGVSDGGNINNANPIEPDAKPPGSGQKHVPSRTVNILSRVKNVLKNTLRLVRSQRR